MPNIHYSNAPKAFLQETRGSGFQRAELRPGTDLRSFRPGGRKRRKRSDSRTPHNEEEEKNGEEEEEEEPPLPGKDDVIRYK